MLEVLGGMAPPEAIFRRVDEQDGLDFLELLLGYARLLRGEERELVRAMAAPYLPLVLPELRRGTAESRAHAVLVLARMGMRTHSDAVAGALRDESPTVAMIAARSLFRPGHDEHLSAVLEQLPRFTGWSRSYLAGMLAAGGAGAAPLLRDILTDTREPPLVRAVAADALRELNDLASVPVASDLLGRESDAEASPAVRHGTSRSDRDRELVVGCIRILEHLGHDEHLPVLRPYADWSDPVVRAAAVSALGALGGPPEISILEARLGDSSFWVSLEAARGLVSLGETGTLERAAASPGPRSLLARQVLAE